MAIIADKISANTTDNQIPLLPISIGKMNTADSWKTRVLVRDKELDTTPLFKATKKAALNKLKPHIKKDKVYNLMAVVVKSIKPIS